MIWYKNTKTGLLFEFDNETIKVVMGKKILKYNDLLNRIEGDADFIVWDVEEEAKKEADKKELATLRAAKAKKK